MLLYVNPYPAFQRVGKDIAKVNNLPYVDFSHPLPAIPLPTDGRVLMIGPCISPELKRILVYYPMLAPKYYLYVVTEGRPLLDPIDIIILRNARKVFAPSIYSAKKIEEASGVRIEYLPHGVDTKFFKPIKGYNRERNYVVLLTVANKYYRKGYDVLFYVAKKLIEKGIKFRWIVHTGRDLKIPPEVKGYVVRSIWGSVPDEQLITLYNLADIYVVLSRAEGFNVPLLEASAVGLPVVATDIPAHSWCEWKIKIPWTHIWYGKYDSDYIISEYYEPDKDQAVEVLLQVIDAYYSNKELFNEWKIRSREGAKKFDIRIVYKDIEKRCP